VLDETGLVENYQIEGTFPMFGNNDKGVAPARPSPRDDRRVRQVHFVHLMRGRQLDVIHREVRGA
jgi:hypothetical protein